VSLLGALGALLRYARPYRRLVIALVFGLIIDAAYYEAMPLSFKFLIDRAIVPKRASVLGLIVAILVLALLVTHTASGVLADQFYAETLFSPSDITRLLQQEGFKDIELHDAPPRVGPRARPRHAGVPALRDRLPIGLGKSSSRRNQTGWMSLWCWATRGCQTSSSPTTVSTMTISR
jgi:hypothetical protein